MAELDTLWKSIYDKFVANGLDEFAANSWISTSKPLSLNDSEMKIEVLDTLQKDYWNRNLTNDLIKYVNELTGRSIVPVIMTAREVKEQSQNISETESTIDFLTPTHLNSKYTFDSFIIGGGNQMAHAASLVVSETPGTVYNPLLIYGGVGLGKTHLMHAIGHRLRQQQPNAKIKYVSSETFTNDYVNSIRTNKQAEFRKEYRNVDLLLVDDIQFFSNKGGTQEEFFHTFNDLFNDKKQIVLTSDRLPNEIPKLEERLVSRFKWGLSVDITPPDLETRIAILRNKSEAEHLDIPSDTLTYIAGQIDTNIRELEGALVRVQAFATVKNEEITTDLAATALRSLTNGQHHQKLSIKKIQQKVAKFYNITYEDIIGKKRTQNIVHPRHIAMYLSRELTDSSLPKIGTEFGGKDHSTILSAFNKIKKDRLTNQTLDNEINQISKSLIS